MNPAFGSLDMLATDAQSFYNSLQFSVNRRLNRGCSLQASYSFSKSVDDDSAAPNSSSPQYGLARMLERGLSDYNIRHRLVMNYFWTPPFGPGQRWGSSFRRLSMSRYLSRRLSITICVS